MEAFELPRVSLSAAERSAGRLNPASLAAARHSLRHAGAVLTPTNNNFCPVVYQSDSLYNIHPLLLSAIHAHQPCEQVLLENVLAPEPLQKLAQRMAADLPSFLSASTHRHGNAPYNFVYGNVQQDPPLELAEHANNEILANPAALQVVSSVMSSSHGVALSFTGNTSLCGSRTQPVHRDASHDAEPFASFVINITLCDVDEQNGSLECWLGTHVEQAVKVAEISSGEKWSGNVPPRLSETRRMKHPPVRVNCRLGSVLLRDSMTWHNGTTNSSSEPRFMVAAIVRSIGPPVSHSQLAPHKFSLGSEDEVKQAQRTLANLWPATLGGAHGWNTTFVPEKELPPTARGEGCYDWDRRYLFPFTTTPTDLRSDTDRGIDQSSWSVPVGPTAPDDGAAAWCRWYWGEGGTRHRKTGNGYTKDHKPAAL